jgi:hypothetical protein
MPRNSDKIAVSKSRVLVEEMLIASKPMTEIIKVIAETTGEAFDLDDVKAYDRDYLQQGKGLVNEVLNVSRNMAKTEIPPANDAEQLAAYFSFKNTTTDLDMIYARIRELRNEALKHPDDDSIDARIVKYLDQAEKIRSRVIKNQFDSLRKTILLTIGKKIASSAVAVFLPYIFKSEKRDEARKKFLAAIEPLINSEMTPTPPADIQDVEKSIDEHGQSTQEK